jgi:hypothetical protein
MSRKTTTHKKPRMAQLLAVLAVVLGAGVIGAAPARADHGPDVSFSFSFGFPAPFVPVPVYQPAPVVVYREPVVIYREPVYAAPRVYYSEPYGQWKKHNRRHDRWDDHRDGRYDRDRSDYRDARW